MGTMTRAQLLTQGGMAANRDDDVGTFVRTWLDTWLKRTAKSWPWPTLKFPITDVAWAAGLAVKVVGSGTGGVSLFLHQLVGDTIIWRNAGYTSQGILYPRQLAVPDPTKDYRTTLAANRRGTPLTFKLRRFKDSPADDGAFTIELDPVPNEAIYLSFDAQIVPPALGDTSATDSQVPWYPNDRTIAHAVKCAFMELEDQGQHLPAYEEAMQHLENMVIADRDFDGSLTGDNQMMVLDNSVFR